MRLLNAATKFNKSPCYDAYTGDLLFYGQLGLYDDTKRDSETAERRVLSLAHGIELPTRRVVDLAGIKFIIGHGNVDTYLGEIIRVGHVIHEATHLATIQTLSQFVHNTAGVSAWAAKAWVKNLGYSEQDSRLNGFHHIHLAVSEVAAPGYVITMGANRYLVRTANDGAAGTLICYSDHMPEPSVETGTVLSGTYNPTTDSMTTASASVRVVRVRWQSLFDYNEETAPTFGPGDQQFALSKAAVAAPVGAKLALSDGAWHVSSADSYGDVWLCRGTQHA